MTIRKGTCGAPGPYGAHCTDYPAHDYSCYDASEDVSFNRHTMEDVPHGPCFDLGCSGAGVRILTVRQPWAWAIIHGGKDVENRVRNIAGDYRGPVAIHAGRSVESSAFSNSAVRDVLNKAARERWYERFDPNGMSVEPWKSVTGAIIGVVDLVDVHDRCWTAYAPRDGGDTVEEYCSAWAEPDANHLVLKNPRPLAEPIPYRGALGLRRLDAITTTRILAQIGE